MKIAAIDIGSNSVRLGLIADGKTLYKRLETTRLGEGLSLGCTAMKSENIERTAQAVSKFAKEAKADGAQKVYAFATAAVRSASNSTVLLQRVKQLCGIQIAVISGEEEAKCGLLGALKGGDGGIIDVGGASTEVTFQRGGKVLYSKSVNIGTVRLFDLCGRDKDKLKTVLDQKLNEYGSFSANGFPVYAIGGTATTIASVKHGLKEYDPAVIDGTRLTLQEVEKTADRLLSLTVEEVKAVAGMEPRRADVIGGGCLLMSEVMRRFGITAVTVSESDNIEGYIMLKEERK